MPALSPDVLRLIRERLENLDQVEVLVLLFESGERAWAATEIGSALGMNFNLVMSSLSALRRRGLIAETDESPARYRFEAESPELASDVKQLLAAYNTQPVTLIRAIYDSRTPLASFADAFRLRKPPGET